MLIKHHCLSLLYPLILIPWWGFFAHQKINRMAVFSLPPGMISFYKANIGYLETHAVDPDKRRYADTAEAPRHYIDIDRYEGGIDSIPRRWQDAAARYTENLLTSNGIVPWHIDRTYYRLVNAFETRNSELIIRLSTEIGHYIADAHVPLHTTQNYNGQLSQQQGIHAFWESRLPELFHQQYQLINGKAGYIENPLLAAWEIVRISQSMTDSVLKLDAELSNIFPADLKYAYSERNNLVLKQHSESYARAYHQRLDGMVERQMRASIHAISSYWMSAWIDAGQPDLSEFASRRQKRPDSTNILERLFKEGRIIGRPEP